MNRLVIIGVLSLLLCVAVCDYPAPDQYDNAMLQEFFGKSPEQVEAAFGAPKDVIRTASEGKEHRYLHEGQVGTGYIYSTPDGELFFGFAPGGSGVQTITYGGRKVAPPKK